MWLITTQEIFMDSQKYKTPNLKLMLLKNKIQKPQLLRNHKTYKIRSLIGAPTCPTKKTFINTSIKPSLKQKATLGTA